MHKVGGSLHTKLEKNWHNSKNILLNYFEPMNQTKNGLAQKYLAGDIFVYIRLAHLANDCNV